MSAPSTTVDLPEAFPANTPVASIASLASSAYYTRPLERDEVLAVANIHYRSFNDPTNKTPDLLARLIDSEPDPETGEKLTQEQYISRTHKRELANYDSGVYSFIGAFARPAGDDSEERLAGFSVWKLVEPSQPSDLTALKAKLTPRERGTLLARFFLQMYQTREAFMAGKTYYWLKLLCIDPDHQRKGVGSLLLKYGLEKAAEKQIDTMLESSPMGVGTYLKSGFEIVEYDSIPEPRSPTGRVQWPYMIHRYQPSLAL